LSSDTTSRLRLVSENHMAMTLAPLNNPIPGIDISRTGFDWENAAAASAAGST
jgi:hypothetical protein